MVHVMFDFSPEQDGDLGLNAGDQVLVLDTSDPGGWWVGRNQFGQEGVFPSNFVQQIN